MARKKTTKPALVEENPRLKKLALYLAIVDYGQSDHIIRIFQRYNSSMQFIQNGTGTAVKAVRDILGLEDNRKEVIFAFVTLDKVEEIKNELNAYFFSSKKNRGIAFTVKLNSLIGVKLYHFLTQTV